MFRHLGNHFFSDFFWSDAAPSALRCTSILAYVSFVAFCVAFILLFVLGVSCFWCMCVVFVQLLLLSSLCVFVCILGCFRFCFVVVVSLFVLCFVSVCCVCVCCCRCQCSVLVFRVRVSCCRLSLCCSVPYKALGLSRLDVPTWELGTLGSLSFASDRLPLAPPL